MKKKLLILFFVIGSVLVCAFGLAACSTKPSDKGGDQGTVQPKPDDTQKPSTVAVESVSLNKITLSLEADEVETLIATVTPDNATNKTVTWKSSDDTVAKVANGKVTALKAGTATITATAGSKSTTCKVTVVEKVVAITSIFLNKTEISLYIDVSETLIETVLPNNTTEEVTWISTAPAVATVANGTITGVSEGTATIIASSPRGITATCEVTVTENTHGYVFEVYGDGYAVAGYTGAETAVKVPSTYKNKSVIAIGTGKTNGSKYVVDGFANCSNLISVVIPNSVTTINPGAFINCSNLTDVTFSNSITMIKDGAFENCTSITELNIPDSVKTIALYAFRNCSSLQKLTLPRLDYSLELLCGYSIAYIKEIVILGGDIIPEGALRGCSGLESLTIPFVGGSKSATTSSRETCFGYIFGDYSYTGSTEIKQYYSYGYNYSKTYYIPTSLKSVMVTGGDALYGAFRGCRNLTNISIPNSVKNIGSYEFSGCSGLTSIVIPNSVTSIGGYAFFDCDSLTSITVPNSVTSIGSYAFDDCNLLTSIIIPNSVTRIDKYAVGYSYYLTIYCEASSRPSGWSSDWNFDPTVYGGGWYCPVVWGYKG